MGSCAVLLVTVTFFIGVFTLHKPLFLRFCTQDKSYKKRLYRQRSLISASATVTGDRHQQSPLFLSSSTWRAQSDPQLILAHWAPATPPRSWRKWHEDAAPWLSSLFKTLLCCSKASPSGADRELLSHSVPLILRKSVKLKRWHIFPAFYFGPQSFN